jgi:GNAT superfamily N-acetyltransferase
VTTSTDELVVRAARPDDEPAILRLLAATMAGGPTGERTSAFFRWKHADNPFGLSLTLVAEAGGHIVGLRTFMRWRFVRDGQEVTAVRAVDTATHPQHQGKGIFTRLTRAALAELVDDTDLVFNTPNGSSLPGYLKMGWTPVGTVPVALRVRRPLTVVRGARRLRATATGGVWWRCDLPAAGEVLAERPAVQALLDQADHTPGRLRTDRTVDYLHWRYACAPGLDYRATTVRWAGELIGLAIGRPRMRGPLAEFTLSEVITRAGDRRTARDLLRWSARVDVDHVATHLGGWPTVDRVRVRGGYVAVPGQGITLVAKPVRMAEAAHLTLGDFALSLGDLEVF